MEGGVAEALYSHVYRLSPAIFTISSPKDGRHIDVNRSWTLATGYSRDEALQNTVVELGLWAKPEDRVKFVDEINAEGFVRGFETTFCRKDGAERQMLLSGEIIKYRGEDCLLVVGQDISERVQLEQMKADFIATVSHELRTPLTSIKGALGLIVSGVTGDVPEKSRSMIEIANRNSDRLIRLINNILDIEKLEAGQLDLRITPTAIGPLIDEAVEANGAFAAQRDVSIVVATKLPDATLHIDHDRIDQVLTNLLSNAAKFSPSGGRVEVSVSLRDRFFRVSVTDHGPGIPENFRARVFEKFAQADVLDADETSGGTGLGLSISKALVEAHGGRIDFVTETDEGTTFFFDLPR